MSNHLSPEFLNEIYKLCFVKKSFLEVCKEHLKFQYIPKELQEMKLILQSIIAQYDLTGKLPSYGIISQQFQSNADVQNALQKIKSSDIIDSELALTQLFQFIRDTKLQILMLELIDTFNADKKEEALKLLSDGSEELNNFSLKSNTGQFLRVFADYQQQNKERQLARESGDDIKETVPFGIDIVDIITDGGLSTGDIALWIMRSGVGKSTVLKHTGMYTCRLGYNVLHIQLEGSKKEAFEKYTQIWTGSTYSEVKWGNIPKEKEAKIEKVLDDMLTKQRDLDIYSFEKYGSASMQDVKNLVIEYEKIKGVFPDLIIIDSLDLLITGDNKKVDFDPAYKKERLQTVAQRMKDLATTFNTRIITATQTGDIPKEKWNNADWVITRENTEADRTLIKPFAHVLTGNQTIDERKKKIFRIHFDKLRYHDIKDATYPIYSSYEVGKFYDKQKTMKEFGSSYEN